MLEEIVATPTPLYPPHQTPHHISKRAVTGWVLYDLANTIFSMGVVSVYFSLWVHDQVGARRADTVYGLITAASMGLIFLFSPLLGAMTDRAPRRMPFLVASTLLCVFFTALLARFGFWATALCFLVANVAYQAGTQFYDAMLPEVSTEENRGKIGGIGVGVGYLGSYVAVGLGLKLVDDKALLFTAIAVAFLVFSVPCFLFVKERKNPRPRPIDWAMVRDSTSQTVRTLKSGQKYPGLVRFLVGRVFYTDSINTVISVMSLYTLNVAISTGLTAEQGQKKAQMIMLFAITFAVVGGFFWGWMTDRLGPKRTLNLVLTAWMVIFAFAGAIGILGLPLWCLYLVAASAGFSLGGVWASDRPYMLRLTPPSRVGEFYGLYGMVGRFSAITGPVLWAASTYVTIQLLHMQPRMGQGLSVIVLMMMIVASYVILQPISDAPREWKGDDLGH